MLDIRKIRENPEEIEARLKSRDASVSLAPVLEIDEKRRKAQTQADELRARQNTVSKEIGNLKKSGGDASVLLKEMAEVAQKVKEWEATLRDLDEEQRDAILRLPNIPHPSVPVSLDKHDNQVFRVHGEKRVFNFQPKNHLELSDIHSLFDFERGARLAGSNFPLYTGLGARLELALINYFIDRNCSRGYKLILPPLLNNADTLRTSGNLPKFEDQLYKMEQDGLYAVPTSEVSLTSLHRDEILDESQLPLKYTSFTPCFRREAGTYGKTERGLVRIHQFNKVEMYKFTTPETSYDELEDLTANAEALVGELGLHYRTMLLVTGDIGNQAAKTYDIEVWLPGQDAYYEVSSCSNCEDYQARRGNIRFRRKGADGKPGKPEFPHTLNGSGLATSRLMVSLLENNQQEDGSITIPQALRPYMGGLERISKE